MGLPTYASDGRSVAHRAEMRHTYRMTMLDLGPERPGQASETREWGERGRTNSDPHHVSNRRFFLLLALIIVGLVVFALLR